MATKMYFLDDTSSHVVTSEDFEEICDLPLGSESDHFLVMATVDLDRDDLVSSNEETTRCDVRLDVLSGFGALLGRDHQEFWLSAVNVDRVVISEFDRAPSSRHASLMVTATVPAEGGAGRQTNWPFTLGEPEISEEVLLVPPPRATLSVRGLGVLAPHSRVALRNVRIVAFQADEVVLKHL